MSCIADTPVCIRCIVFKTELYLTSMNMHAYAQNLISISSTSDNPKRPLPPLPSMDAKPKPLLPALPSKGESLTLNRKDRTTHTDDNYKHVIMQAPRVVRRESSPESNTLVRNESLEIDPTDDCMSGVQIAESDAVRPAHGIASQHSSGKKCL